jgi:hypothetical protein
MKTKIIYLLIFLLTFSFQAKASNVWGPTGHRVVGAIAEDYLTPRTKRKLKKLLKKKSMAFLSTFADEIKSDRKFNEYYSWHYINMPMDSNYTDSEKNPKGDLYTGIETCKKVIQDENSSDADKIFHLKMLIHFMGDLHQPLHIGLKEDKGGNDFKVQWHYKDTNLHSVWDSKMIDSYDMGYQELTDNADELSREQIKSLQEGSLLDWVNETHELTRAVYKSAEKDENLRYRYSYKHFPIVRSQLQKGGIRLAKVLNDLF